jgi:hypothetical protein
MLNSIKASGFKTKNGNLLIAAICYFDGYSKALYGYFTQDFKPLRQVDDEEWIWAVETWKIHQTEYKIPNDIFQKLEDCYLQSIWDGNHFESGVPLNWENIIKSEKDEKGTTVYFDCPSEDIWMN